MHSSMTLPTTTGTPHIDAHPEDVRGDTPDASHQVHPIGSIESPLLDAAELGEAPVGRRPLLAQD